MACITYHYYHVKMMVMVPGPYGNECKSSQHDDDDDDDNIYIVTIIIIIIIFV